jgi:bifunctional ADP-heptose synthase (sugar kinase/adenylyltransferase)
LLLLAALSCVDHVLSFEHDTPHELLRVLRPDVLVKGGTTPADHVVGSDLVAEYGGRVARVGMRPGISTTALIEQVLARGGSFSPLPLGERGRG